ncbi:MAG: hypothetical protein AW12_02338 [Candidatus Accumulibacter sp. BA-94]|nr:MAG: hypothetical protein AW12_02338 [Candidatus Accumulibacter sp. BA-94]
MAAGWSVGPGEAAAGDGDPALADAVCVPAHELRRHRVEDLVCQDNTTEARRQLFEPVHAGQQVWRPAANGVALTATQLARQLENRVTFGQPALPFQFEQEVAGQLAAAAADLDQLRRTTRLQLLQLGGQRLGERR